MNKFSPFNINGSIGYGAYETPDYPTANDFIKHLDYLGIDHSLVWHVEARDLNPTLGNKRLLKEISDSGTQERLIPAFVVTPACYFEYGTMDFLRKSFASGKVKALRIMPTVSRFPVRHLERLLFELAEFEPLVLWDCGTFTDENDVQGIEYLAQKIPQINFALTQKMWSGFGSVLDLMWRCSNIYIDISWLHMRDTIELLRDEFGAERILFGIGSKGHYGAAIAMLAHAQITDNERELIAHGNIERLLKLKPENKKLAVEPELLKQKPLWCKFQSGKAIDDVKIIDAHGHDGPHTRGWFLREGNIETIVKQMDRLGVDKLILSGERALFGDAVEGNKLLEKDALSFKDRIAGYLGFNPHYAEKICPLFDDFFKRDFYIGFKILAAYWKIPLTDLSYSPVWKYANKYCLPILLHTWDDKYNSPAMLKDIVKQYPNAIFLLGHSGGGTVGRLEAEKLVMNNDNVYLEFCGSFTTPIPFENSAGKVGWDKVLFGSDTGAHSEAWELGRFLSMPVPDKTLIPALGENFNNIISSMK